MGKTRAEKVVAIEKIEQALAGAKGVAFVNFAGLTVKEVTELRRQCRAAGVAYFVAKKTLLKLAFERAGTTGSMNPRELPGGIAAVFGTSDEISAAKLVNGFAKDHPAVQFVGGLLPEGTAWKFLSAAEVTLLAKLPGRQELLAQFVGTVANPLRGFVGVLAGTMRSFVQVLEAVRQAKA